MWIEFVLAAFVATLLLYGPGYLFFRALRLSGILALACAPLFGIFMYSALPVVYYGLGVGCSVVTVVLPTLLVAACAWLVARRRGGLAMPHFSVAEQGSITLLGRSVRCDVAIPAAYVGVATIVCLWVFVTSLPQASAFYPRYDNQTHLNLIRTFLDTGNWSTLHTSTYLALPEHARATTGTGGFYPAAWHCLVALVNLVTGVELTTGLNAVVTVVACVVFPLGMYAFLSAVFRKNRRAVAFGVFATTGFAVWPWLFLVTGPLYPNQLGISMLFSTLALAIEFVRGEHSPATIPRFAACCVISFVALTLSHPSVVFLAYVFFACYGSHVLWRRVCPEGASRLPTKGRASKVGLLACYWTAIVAFWALCFFVPQLKEVTSYQVGSTGSVLRVLGSTILLKFGTLPLAQVGMSLASAVGCVACLRSKEYRWLLMPVAFFAAATIAAYVNDSSPLAHMLGGFWYTDGRRLSVNTCLFLMPVVALGMTALLLQRRARAGRVLLAAILIFVYLPVVRIPMGEERVPVSQLLSMRDMVCECYGGDDAQVYSTREVDFVNRAKELVPTGALVANYAPDGSVWAYGVNGLNTVYRSHRIGGQKPEAVMIREHLCEYATNPEVREAVQKMDVSFVLLLNKGVAYADGHWVPQFKEKAMDNWAGIGGIDDSTPGFTAILAEGDQMRLYKIER